MLRSLSHEYLCAGIVFQPVDRGPLSSHVAVAMAMCASVCGVSSFQKRQTCNFLIKCYCKIGRRRKYAMIWARCACMRLADTAATTQQNNALTSMASIPTTDLLFFFSLVFARRFAPCIDASRTERTADCMVSRARCPHLHGELLLVYFRV